VVSDKRDFLAQRQRQKGRATSSPTTEEEIAERNTTQVVQVKVCVVSIDDRQPIPTSSVVNGGEGCREKLATVYPGREDGGGLGSCLHCNNFLAMDGKFGTNVMGCAAFSTGCMHGVLFMQMLL